MNKEVLQQILLTNDGSLDYTLGANGLQRNPEPVQPQGIIHCVEVIKPRSLVQRAIGMMRADLTP